jgi:hypothetical protein
MAKRAQRMSRHVPILTADELAVLFGLLETDYAEVSAFYGSDPRTGHRWQTSRPSNQAARMSQLMRTLNLTQEDVERLIGVGTGETGSAVPSVVLDIRDLVRQRLGEEDSLHARRQRHHPKGPLLGASGTAA